MLIYKSRNIVFQLLTSNEKNANIGLVYIFLLPIFTGVFKGQNKYFYYEGYLIQSFVYTS